MALKKSEKTLVGVALIAGAIALVVSVALPQWDAFLASSGQITTLQQEIEGMNAQKTNLNAQIALLNRNTDIPADILIRTYNESNRAQIIKELLDNVVGLATEANNKFISLVPREAEPVLPPPQKKDTKTTGAQTAAGAATDPAKPEEAEVSAPILSTFGYDLAIRGTYQSVQAFLRAMDTQKELLEISSIQLENEAGNQQSSTDTDARDPNYPIRLIARIRLALQPEKP